jgi:hypothetical protein
MKPHQFEQFLPADIKQHREIPSSGAELFRTIDCDRPTQRRG